MSEELRRKLEYLEEDYAGMPPAMQRADLREINAIRAELGMPEVDDRLNVVNAPPVPEAADVPSASESSDPIESEQHVEGRQIYEAYLVKREHLKRYQEYANEVAEATAGRGQTPVRPLATMGTNGGPLLCDHCKKPIVLEGGKYHGISADVAWESNPRPKWKSWILGGVIIEIQTNGTLRVYHGYPGNDRDCCSIALREDKAARLDFDSSEGIAKEGLIEAYLADAFPDMTPDARSAVLSDIFQVMFRFDPGLGINRPC